MQTCIDEESEMVVNTIFFTWKISKFSVEDLLVGVLISPSFKCFSADLHLEMSHSLDKMKLQLVQSDSGDPPRIVQCQIGFYLSNSPTKSYFTTHTAPVKHTDISHSIPMDRLRNCCIADCVLKVHCILKVQKLKHTIDVQSRTQRIGNEETYPKQGHTTLGENFRNLLEDSRFSDIILKVGEDAFQAHKAILASRSKVFDGMFQSGMKESQESVVEIVDIKPAILKEMLQYVYSGTIGALSIDRAVDLYVGADRYDLQELKGWCKEFILKHISFDDVCRVAVMADLHSDEELAKATKRVFKENSQKILASEEWREFKNQHPIIYSELVESALLNDSQV